MIINRYLRREISRPFVPILGILMALFASYNVAAFLSDAVSGLLAADTIAELVGLKLLISLEVLIPIALYISVVLAFGRLYSDSEFVAAFALRVTPGRVMAAVLALSGCLALLVAGLSLAARPWAYGRLHALSDRAAATLDVDGMQAGTFYLARHGDRVIFFSRRDGPGLPAQDVFVQLWRGEQVRIIHARLASRLPPRTPDGGSLISLRDAHVYDIGRGDGQDDQVLDARDLVIDPNGRLGAAPAYSSVAASTRRLASSGSAEDIAELQWRLSTPLSTLLLGMLGIPMSRSGPRQSRWARLGAAIAVYFGYYVLYTSARTWVQHGAVAGFPGIWWVPALLGVFLLVALCAPDRDSGLRRA